MLLQSYPKKFLSTCSNHLDSSCSSDLNYNDFIKAAESAIKLVPLSTRSSRIYGYNNADLESARQKVKDSPFQSKERSLACKNLNELELQFHKAYVSQCIDQVDKASDQNKTRLAYSIVNNITGRKSYSKSKIAADNSSERLKKWSNYFSSLLNVLPTQSSDIPPSSSSSDTTDPWEPSIIHSSRLPIPEGPTNLDELLSVIKKMSNNKATGVDNISTEFLKIPGVLNLLLPYINHALESGQSWEAWRRNIIIPLPKKGDLSQCSNYRGISLMSIVGKLYNKLLQTRISPFLDPVLRKNQNGFRPHRGTLEQVLSIRRIIEGLSVKGGSGVMTFIDFSKAFDSINQSRMFKVCSAYGISSKVVQQISAMYIDSQSAVSTEDGISEFFQISTGVLQGDTLAPLLFILMIDYVMSLATRDPSVPLGIEIVAASGTSLRPKPRQAITDLEFADDIALLNDSIETSQVLLSNVEKYAAELGLQINRKKTEYIILGKHIDRQSQLFLTSGPINLVDDFKYLGSWIINSKQDIITRIGQAWTAAKKLNSIWRSHLNNDLKERFFNAIIESILFYGCETWSMTNTLNKLIDGAHSRLLRYAFNVHWSELISNASIFEKHSHASNIIRRRRLRFAGHCIRSTGLNNSTLQPISQLIFWEKSGSFRRGGQQVKTYPQTLAYDIESTGLRPLEQITEEFITTLANDRIKWKKLINSI